MSDEHATPPSGAAAAVDDADPYSTREPVRRGIPLIISAVGLTVLMLWSVVPVRHRIEGSLEAKSVRALTDSGVIGIDVTMTGRDARLEGQVADAATRKRIHDLVRSRVGMRHVDDSGLRGGEEPARATGAGSDPTTSDTTAASPQDADTDTDTETDTGAAGTFEIAFAGGRVAVSGTLPDDPKRSALAAALRSTFGAELVDGQLRVDQAAGGPNDAQVNAITALLGTMRGLDVNGVRLAWVDGVLHLRGTVRSDADRAAITGKAEEVLGAAGVRDELTVAGAAAASTTSVATGTPTTTSAAGAATTATTVAGGTGPTTTLTAAAAAVADDISAVLAAGTVEFALGSSELTAAGAATVAKLAAALAKQPNVAVAIDGHTDNDGSAARNAELSQARADTVKAALVAQGIAAARLTATGFGSTKPIADNATAAGRQKNRRIEFRPSGG